MLDTLDYELNPISFLESLEYANKAKKLKPIEFIFTFLEKVSNLDARQINQLPLPDAISLLLLYLIDNFQNPEVYKDTYANDFTFQVPPNYNEKIIKIGKYRFTNKIPMIKAIEIENYCYTKGRPDLLSIYLLCGHCLKGTKEGVETILNGDDSIELRNDIKALNNAIGSISLCKLDLLNDLENISLVTQKNTVASLDLEFFFYK